ncbi:hypothetical protein EUA07_17050 [Nocardioides ganghwensis]|uniref:Uncharacterized protein n=1 Tax=Nocardioides ganghwensis TaxID=252230 RepID=A0A4Q2S7Z7_9ACTN|nr:hypothetical protein EUA07_17050 [Nocardioides ganghwensis]
MAAGGRGARARGGLRRAVVGSGGGGGSPGVRRPGRAADGRAGRERARGLEPDGDGHRRRLGSPSVLQRRHLGRGAPHAPGV